jgi:hypothetical protein
MNLLFHIHTNNSYDCILKPESIVKFALKNEINAIAITDHDTIKGSVEAAKYVLLNKLDIKIIIGAEYYTDCGDIIGLFLKKEINEKNAEKLIDEIHKQGGIAVLPHPFKSHKLNETILQKIDVIETFNTRCTIEQNLKAEELSKKYNKPAIAGNDAHLEKELELCYNKINNTLLFEAIMSDKDAYKEYTSKLNVIKSQLIKGVKNKEIFLILKMFKSILSLYLFQPLRRFLKMNKN